jgi:NAD(P)-dependent dehydrogenase (short-subunit alcohol dehydrogenase family)
MKPISAKTGVALVVGASSGLGFRAAQVLAEQGWHVVLAARRTERLQVLADLLHEKGFANTMVQMDVMSCASIKQGINQIEADTGPIQVLYNGAGIGLAKNLIETTQEEIDELMAVNLRGAFLVAQAVAQHMIARNRATDEKLFSSIINIASTSGLRNSSLLGIYGASKAGLVHLTKAMALEWGPHGVNINAICPGFILTDLNRYVFETARGAQIIDSFPRKRIGQPEDLDGVIRLLSSPESRFMNGAVINLDDGQTIP